MDPLKWQAAKIGRWGSRSEHITVKEGRCLVLSVRRLSRDSQRRGMRNLMLVDNLALAMAISNGRAHDYTMLRIFQQVGALSLACDMSLRVRVPSEVNPADGPSRGSHLPGSAWKETSELRGKLWSEQAGATGIATGQSPKSSPRIGNPPFLPKSRVSRQLNGPEREKL